MIYQRTLALGFDLTKGPIPVVPAAHYCCGGVVSTLDGQTDLGRLYVAGETAYTGLHGANRLASNSLLEAIFFARNAAVQTNEVFSKLKDLSSLTTETPIYAATRREEVLVSYAWDEVRRLMWHLVGIVRSNQRLDLAARRITAIADDVATYFAKFRPSLDLIELRNITDVARLIIESARLRQESRGLHFNLDYPKHDDRHWNKPSILCYDSLRLRNKVTKV